MANVTTAIKSLRLLDLLVDDYAKGLALQYFRTHTGTKHNKSYLEIHPRIRSKINRILPATLGRASQIFALCQWGRMKTKPFVLLFWVAKQLGIRLSRPPVMRELRIDIADTSRHCGLVADLTLYSLSLRHEKFKVTR